MKLKKYNLFGVQYSVVDSDTFNKIILEKATERKSFGVSMIDLKKLLTKKNGEIVKKINNIDLVLPTSKIIKRALNSFYHLRSKENISSEEVLNQIMAIAHLNNLNVYLFGSTKNNLTKVCNYLNQNFPFLNVVGVYVEKYLDFVDDERVEDIERINHSAANIVLVGKESGNLDAWIANHVGKIHSVLVSAGPAFKNFFENGNGLDTPLKITIQFKIQNFLYKTSKLFQNLLTGFYSYLRFYLLFFKHRFFIRSPL